MRRREFVAGVTCALALPSLALAQRPAGIPRIGFLGPRLAKDDLRVENLRQLQEGLRDLGYVDGKTIAIEWRFAERYDDYPTLVAELLRLKVAVIVTPNTPGVLAAKRATSTTPIVFTTVTDPVGSGLVASLARPGGNVTGLNNVLEDLSAKLLELLREASPSAARVALLFNGANPGNVHSAKEARKAAPALNIELQFFDVRGRDDLGRAIDELGRQRVHALMVLQDAFLLGEGVRIVRLAQDQRLPAIYNAGEHVGIGGLMSYGPSRSDLFRRVAGYVDRILKGAKPADLPVEQPTKFELAVNLRTAKELGLTIPQSILLRADRVIE